MHYKDLGFGPGLLYAVLNYLFAFVVPTAGAVVMNFLRLQARQEFIGQLVHLSVEQLSGMYHGVVTFGMYVRSFAIFGYPGPVGFGGSGVGNQ